MRFNPHMARLNIKIIEKFKIEILTTWDEVCKMHLTM